LFALEGKTFRKHSALEAALHKDLVKSGRWTTELGADYRSLRTLRSTGDYGGMQHVSAAEVEGAIGAAGRILIAAKKTCRQLGQGDQPPESRNDTDDAIR